MPNKKTKKLTYFVILILIIALVAIFLIIYNKNSKSSSTNSKTNSFIPKGNTSKPTNHSLTNSGSPNSGGVVSQTGSQTGFSLPPSNEWTSSSNNEITLQYPVNSTTFKSGDQIVGLSSVSPVDFIIVDNSVGQIASGNLNVVNGKFNATVKFTAHSNSGELQIYHPNPNNGAEEDVININLSF